MTLTRRDWSGEGHLPRTGGFVIVTNHLSHVDPLTLAHFLHDNGVTPHFLGKREVFEVPVIGRILLAAEQVPVYRETGQAADAYRAAVAGVQAGHCVVFYPEGTLTRDPGLWPMRGKTGAVRVALQTGCPVIPVAQWGPQEILAPYSHRPALFPRKLMRVRAGAPVPLTDLVPAGGGMPSPSVLASATDRVMAALTSVLEELRGERAPAERFDPARPAVPGTPPHAGTTLASGKPVVPGPPVVDDEPRKERSA